MKAKAPKPTCSSRTTACHVRGSGRPDRTGIAQNRYPRELLSCLAWREEEAPVE